MNVTNLLLGLHIALLCMATCVVIARPSRSSRQRPSDTGRGQAGSNSDNSSSSNNNNKRASLSGGGERNSGGNSRNNKRTRSAGRRFRMLQKILKKLTPDDVMQLARAKKNHYSNNGDYGNQGSFGYGYGHVGADSNLPGISGGGHNQAHHYTPVQQGTVEELGPRHHNMGNPHSVDGMSYGTVETLSPSQQQRHTTLLNTNIECPSTKDAMHTFACPTPDHFGRYQCIDVRALCNDLLDCPNGEDENKTVCMFHKMHMNYFKEFTDAIIGLTPPLFNN